MKISKNFYYTNDVSKLNHHLYNAGILPYQIGLDGKIYFLLGKDQQGYWSDFGGKCDSIKDKNNIKHTAARELFEESCGSLMSIEETKKMLVNSNNYVLINSESLSGISYYMFILKVPFRPNVVSDRFNRTYNVLKYVGVNYQYVEKNEVKWFSLDKLINMIDGKKSELGPLKEVFRQTLINNKHELHILQRSHKKRN